MPTKYTAEMAADAEYLMREEMTRIADDLDDLARTVRARLSEPTAADDPAGAFTMRAANVQHRIVAGVASLHLDTLIRLAAQVDIYRAAAHAAEEARR